MNLTQRLEDSEKRCNSKMTNAQSNNLVSSWNDIINGDELCNVNILKKKYNMQEM